jgi:iron complex outermembrane recepter protein
LLATIALLSCLAKLFTSAKEIVMDIKIVNHFNAVTRLAWVAPALVANALIVNNATAQTVPNSTTISAPNSVPLSVPNSAPDSAQPSAQTLAPVVITSGREVPGSVQRGVSGISDATLIDSPQAISSIGREVMRDAGASSLSSIMKFEPSASDAYNTLGYIESLSVRGFLLDNSLNYRRDGLAFSNYMPVSLENKERVQVLKGVSGVQTGLSAPGGLVNYVLKRPSPSPINEATLSVSERGSVSIDADLGGRSPDRRFGYRVNAAIGERRPNQDKAPGSRSFVSGFFDWKITEHDIFEFEFEHARSKQISVPGFGLIDTNGDGIADTIAAVVSSKLNINSQPWSQPFESVSTIGSFRYERTLSTLTDQQWKAGIRASSQLIKTNDRLAFPDGCSTGPQYVYPGLCANNDVDIYDYRSENEKRSMKTVQFYVSGDVKTGAIAHDINFALLRNQYRERFEAKQAYNFVGTVNALAPQALAPDASANDLNTPLQSTTKELSLSDALTWNQYLLWAGLRHTQLNRSSQRTDGSRSNNYQQSFTTPWIGFGYKPNANGLIYFSAGSGVESEVVPNRPNRFTNPGAVLPALKSKQVELGFKQQWLDRQKKIVSSLTMAIFAIKKPFSDDLVIGSDLLPTRVAGARKAEHNGLEVSGTHLLQQDLSTFASVTFLSARQTQDAENLYVGKHSLNVAPVSLRVGAEWKIAPQLKWQNSLDYSGKKPVTRDNTIELAPSYQWDTSISYKQAIAPLNLTWRAGINNVLDKRYWKEAPTQYWGGTYLFAAEPRTFRVSVSASY